MIKQVQLRVTPNIAYREESLIDNIAKELGIDRRTIHDIRLKKRSIDARQRVIYVNLTVDVFINEDAPETEFEKVEYKDVSNAPQAIVVGAGPGGLFAALRLIELGIKPIVLERGSCVNDRNKDIAETTKTGIVNPESNYSFGEGGAGAFSDGKLYTRSKKRGNVEKVLRVLCQHGAKTEILCDVHPHIGTDKLPRVISEIRKTIIRCGGEVRFHSLVKRLLIDSSGKVCGVGTFTGMEFTGPVILATGHSARDVYRMLRSHNVYLEPKGLAIGVRVEHPAQLIDQIQYHSRVGRGKYLPAAEYSFVTQCGGRGVYSFCMCPGGFVVPAASGPEQTVVNGMSPSNRGTAWSNSGMVVETRLEDLDGELAPYIEEAMNDNEFSLGHADFNDPSNPLRMMYLQDALERSAWMQGGRNLHAPAQRMADFVAGKLSYDLPASISYRPGAISSPLHFWMPQFIASRLREGLKYFGQKSRGYLTNEATVYAIETRTSSPVRITRDPSTLCHVGTAGLFPCGEGAGYAGGIVSAAIDGERCAEALAMSINNALA